MSINSKVFNIGLNGFSRMFFCQRMTRISRILVFLSILRIFVPFVPIVLNFFVNGFHRFHGIYFSLSPDEPDEPDGWRNVISGSSGSSGDYKTTYFTKDNLFNQCNLLTEEKTSCCPCCPLAIIISVGKKISVQSVKSDVRHISAVNPQPPMAVSDRHPKCRPMRRER